MSKHPESAPPPSRTSRRQAVATWLAYPGTAVAAALVSALLASGTLDDGLSFDDRVQRAIVRDSSPLLHGSFFDLFRTATGDPGQVGALVDAGAFPWFAHPALRVTFFRPLASAWHSIDYLLWPDAAWLMHAENLVLRAGLVLLVGMLFRRVISFGWAAGVATFFYAVDEAHAVAVGWIAARNGLMAAAISVGLLIVHRASAVDPRPRRRMALGAGAGALFAAALASSELALGATGFLVAFALWLDPRPARIRVLSLTPYAALLGSWAVSYHALGYGVHGSGYYVDPFGDPNALILGTLHNFPKLMVAALGLPGRVSAWLGDAPLLRTFMPVAAVLLVAIAVLPMLRRDRTARFFATGLVLALLPLCGTLPQGRLLLIASVGAMGIVGQLFATLSAPRAHGPVWRGAAWPLAACFVVTHGIIAPVAFPLRAAGKSRESQANRAAIRRASQQIDWQGRTLVLVRAPHAFAGAEFLFDHLSHEAPARVRMLHVGPGPVVFTRLDPHTLSFHDAGGMLREPVSWLFRGWQHPLPAGRPIALKDVTFEIASVTTGGRPRTVVCRFDRPLRDDAFAWLIWRAGRYDRFDLPAVGEQRTVP